MAMVKASPFHAFISRFYFGGAEGTNTFQVIVVLVYPEPVKQWFWQIIPVDPEINHSGTNFTFKMPVGGSIRIVPDLIALNVEGKGHP
jgi:hypothetical protein